MKDLKAFQLTLKKAKNSCIVIEKILREKHTIKKTALHTRMLNHYTTALINTLSSNVITYLDTSLSDTYNSINVRMLLERILAIDIQLSKHNERS